MIKLKRRAGKPASTTRRQNPSTRSSTDAPRSPSSMSHPVESGEIERRHRPAAGPVLRVTAAVVFECHSISASGGTLRQGLYNIRRAANKRGVGAAPAVKRSSRTLLPMTALESPSGRRTRRRRTRLLRWPLLQDSGIAFKPAILYCFAIEDCSITLPDAKEDSELPAREAISANTCSFQAMPRRLWI